MVLTPPLVRTSSATLEVERHLRMRTGPGAGAVARAGVVGAGAGAYEHDGRSTGAAGAYEHDGTGAAGAAGAGAYAGGAYWHDGRKFPSTYTYPTGFTTGFTGSVRGRAAARPRLAVNQPPFLVGAGGGMGGCTCSKIKRTFLK